MENVGIVSNNIERIILNFIFFSLAGLSLLYVLFLGNMVVNIVERRSLEAEARALEGEVRGLEVTYLARSSSIDLNLANSLGFRETPTYFAVRKSLGYIQNDL